MVCERTSEAIEPLLLHGASSAELERNEPGTLRNAEPGLRLYQLTCGTRSSQPKPNRQTQPVSPPPQSTMLRQILLNSTDSPDFDLVLLAQSSTQNPSSLNASHGGSVSVAALLRPTAGRGGGLREGELHKPDLITYLVMCLLLFLLVLLIVFFINCQLRNSFFASMPYDRSLREARTTYK